MPVTVERFEALISVHRYADAEACARDLIAQYPDWGAGYTHLSRALIELKRYPEALDAAKEGVRKSPHDAWAHVIVGLVYERLQQPSDAVAAAREALRLYPTYSFAYCLLSYNYDRLMRYQDALEATTTGLKHYPHDQELLRFHAFNLFRLNRFDEADKVARECLRLHPTSHEAFDVLGRLAVAMAEKSLFRRISLHRVAHGYYLQALRLKPTMEHTQLNVRDNAVSCGRFVWFWFCWLPYLFLFGLATFVALGLLRGTWSATASPGQFIVIPAFVAIGVVIHFVVLEADPAFFLSLPLVRFGLPRPPPHDAWDRPKEGNDWRLLLGIPPVAAMLVTFIASIMQ